MLPALVLSAAFVAASSNQSLLPLLRAALRAVVAAPWDAAKGGASKSARFFWSEPMLREIEVFTTFMGFDAVLRVEFEITSWGSPAIVDYIWGGDPAEPPEWEIQEIGLSLDGCDSGEWKPEWWTRAWRRFALNARVEQAIIDDIKTVDRPHARRGHRRYWNDAAE